MNKAHLRGVKRVYTFCVFAEKVASPFLNGMFTINEQKQYERVPRGDVARGPPQLEE